jgi:hypothetical protein
MMIDNRVYPECGDVLMDHPKPLDRADVDRTISDHPFHSGTVESNLYWKDDVLHLGTVGYGYGVSPLHTAANYGVGLTYFGLWQAAVKYNVDVIRTSQSPKP